MSVQVEKLEHNMAKLTITVPAETFNKAITQAYKKMKNQISIPGFRKGKVPQAMVEKMYGAGMFYKGYQDHISASHRCYTDGKRQGVYLYSRSCY